MKSKPQAWIALLSIGMVGLIAAIVIGVATDEDDDPRPFIRDHYQRAASLDQADGGAAYTSSDPRGKVVSDLRSATEEYDHRHQNGEPIEFLQYDDHIVAVSDRSGGSLIYVDAYRDGYRRYSSHYGYFAFFGWSSSPPGAGGYRGGGGGFGK